MKQLENKHPLAIRWFHWINFPVLMVMIWSGLLIYWAVDDNYQADSKPNLTATGNNFYQLRVGTVTIFRFFPPGFYKPQVETMEWKTASHQQRAIPEGTAGHVERYKPLYDLSGRLAEGMGWHFLFMWFFFINGLLYVLYTAISGEWRYLVPNRNTLKEAWQVTLHDLYLSKHHPPRRKFNGAQQIAYTSIIVMGLGSLVTGLAVYKPVQFGWLATLCGGYGAARFIHFWLTIGYILFFCVHILQVIRAGWNNFRAMVTGYEVVPASISVVASTALQTPAPEAQETSPAV